MFRRNLIAVLVVIVTLLGTLLVGQEGWTECIQCDVSGKWAQTSGNCGACETIYTKTGECTYKSECPTEVGGCDCVTTGSDVDCVCQFGDNPSFTCAGVLNDDCCSLTYSCTKEGGCTSTAEKLGCTPPSGCAGSAAASTLGVDRVHGTSDSGKHLAYFLLPLGAVIGLIIWRRKR